MRSARRNRTRGRTPRPGRLARRSRSAGGAPRQAGPDRAALLRGARIFLAGIGEDGLAGDRRKTPKRVADAWSREIVGGYREDPARILGAGFPGRESGMVVVREIPFVSVCVHHLLPFRGTAHVAYMPDGRLAGLSKVARAVDVLARRLQLQERLTRQVVQAIDTALRPKGAACRMDAEHLCMTIRGARKSGTRVATAAYSGLFASNAGLRTEFLRLSAAAAPGGAPRLRRPRGARRRGARRG